MKREQILLTEAQEKKGGSWKNLDFGGNPNAKDLAVFTRQFSVMIDAGVPLVQCLEILGDQQDKKKFQAVIQTVQRDVESGSNLADAMKTHSKVFDDLYTNMVAAGEAGGILDTIFQRLSVYIEKAVKLKRAVQSAMVYPIAVVLIAAGVITLILWKVVPQFTILVRKHERGSAAANSNRHRGQQVCRRATAFSLVSAWAFSWRVVHDRITGRKRGVTLLTDCC